MTMEPPVLLIADPEGGQSSTADALRARYLPDYTLEFPTTADEAEARLRHLAAGCSPLALVLVATSMGPADVLESARTLHPQARRGLLLDWNESRVRREEVAEAFARRHAECFVSKPVAAPDERFHRTITELLDEWWRLHSTAIATVRIIGTSRSPRASEIGDVLQRHDVPFAFHTAGSPEGRRALEDAGADLGAEPVIVLHDGRTLVDPTNIELANALGARTRPGSGTYDVIVVGGGPAGLSAAVYAGSEGLRTALVEPTAMGGQAGTSSMIRNYLGFPRGVSGAELAARAFEQAILFGTEMIYGNRATGLHEDGDLRVVTLADGTEVRGRSVVIATGVSYRRLGIPALEALHGEGVFYGAATSEAPALAGGDVYVVGGGNSAGQAAVHLAKFARNVTILVRSESLAASMSDYLITEIAATPNVHVRYGTEVVGGGGGRGRLEHLELRERSTGRVTREPADGLFVLIGAEPFTAWLPPAVERDEWGYILTGPDAGTDRAQFESHLRGVFAIGDVRRDSIKRVASAAGEGAVCVRLIHEYLAGTEQMAASGSPRPAPSLR
jgi:thioredoxin reductase (NADPH)